MHPLQITFSKVPASKQPLGSVFEAFLSSCNWFREVFRTFVGCLLGILTGGPVGKIRFINASGGVGASFGTQMVCGDGFGWYLEAFLVVLNCIFSFL